MDLCYMQSCFQIGHANELILPVGKKNKNAALQLMHSEVGVNSTKNWFCASCCDTELLSSEKVANFSWRNYFHIQNTHQQDTHVSAINNGTHRSLISIVVLVRSRLMSQATTIAPQSYAMALTSFLNPWLSSLRTAQTLSATVGGRQ